MNRYTTLCTIGSIFVKCSLTFLTEISGKQLNSLCYTCIVNINYALLPSLHIPDDMILMYDQAFSP